MTEPADDFVFCDARWETPDTLGEHLCAENEPSHDKHVCCCGVILGASS